jgi:hypothetical protein
MDYARFNYVAQPEDNINEKGLFPRIGVYDKWAIEWGYKLIPEAKTAEDETPILNRWITDSLKANKFLLYGAQGNTDPRNQSEVLSDNPMVANAYGIKNLKAIIPHIMEWTAESNKGYDKAKEIYKAVFDQYQRYLAHVVKFIAGRYINMEFADRSTIESVPAAKQKEALRFINEQFFNTPGWLVSDPAVFTYYGFLPALFANSQQGVIGTLLDNELLDNFSNQSLYKQNDFTINDYLNELTNYILPEITNGKLVTEPERKNLQRIFVTELCAKIQPGATTIVSVGPFSMKANANVSLNSDPMYILKEHLQKLNAAFKKSIAATKDAGTKIHLADLQERIEIALNAAKTKSRWNKK